MLIHSRVGNERLSPSETSVTESDSQPVNSVATLDGKEENKALGIDVSCGIKRDVISFASKEASKDRCS